MAQGYLHDEQGKRSTGRLAFWIVLPWIISLVSASLFFGFIIPDSVINLLATLFGGVVILVGGPRMGQYLGGIWDAIGSRWGNKFSSYVHTQAEVGRESNEQGV